MTKQEILRAALRQAAVDCSCREEDFLGKDNRVTESRPAPGASRYLQLPHILALYTFGNSIVASCRRDLMPEVKAFLDRAEAFYLSFEAPGIWELDRILEKAGARIGRMHSFYLPDPDRVFTAECPCSLEIREMCPADFRDLYLPEWGNALCSKRKELDVLGFGAYDGDELAALAACSADTRDMLQIGIDVKPAYRHLGLASALTNRLARAVFGRGKIPFYAASWSNIPSIKNALRCGFFPAWAAMTAVKKETGPE